MFVLIACPIYDREWILPAWFAAIEHQDFPLRNVGFLFEVSPDDEPTLQCLLEFAEKHPELKCFDIQVNNTDTHTTHPEGNRIWNWERYETMVRFRNNLLHKAVCLNPDRYFSLDSDILLENPRTISELVQLTATLDAVSPLMFMTPEGQCFPSTMTWTEGVGSRAVRITYPLGSLFETDIIMAAKMMSRPVYQNVRYQFHRLGEDLGWSTQASLLGYKLYMASYLYCPHIMSRQMLQDYKREGDNRRLERI